MVRCSLPASVTAFSSWNELIYVSTSATRRSSWISGPNAVFFPPNWEEHQSHEKCSKTVEWTHQTCPLVAERGESLHQLLLSSLSSSAGFTFLYQGKTGPQGPQLNLCAKPTPIKARMCEAEQFSSSCLCWCMFFHVSLLKTSINSLWWL